MSNKILVADVKNGATLPAPIYKVKPYVILNSDNVVLSAGTLDYLMYDCHLSGSYYDDCVIDIRRYDLAYNDNTKIENDDVQENDFQI